MKKESQPLEENPAKIDSISKVFPPVYAPEIGELTKEDIQDEKDEDLGLDSPI